MSRTIWQVATVIDTAPGRLRLAFDPLSGCQQCLRGEGCGAGVFSRLFSRRQAVIVLERVHKFQSGQKVRVGVATVELARAALLLYGLPLIAFVTGALIGQAMFDETASSDLAALSGGLFLAILVFFAFRALPLPGLNPRLEPLSCNSSGRDA